jgi:dTDP-4-amino-4,6-dideoxygalactose transaminase
MIKRIGLGYNAVPLSARKAILDVFDSGQFSPGPRIREFEDKFAKLHEAKHAIFLNSGTDALRMGLLALKEKYGWKDGDEVIVPALTFVATVNVILQAGLKPFFVDVNSSDYLMNPNSNWEWEQGTNQPAKNIVAIMPVHLFGKSCSACIFERAREKGWKVVEDSCETILNSIQGDVSCHSTYMAHHLVTGVGGFALTNDGELNLLMRSYANHGRNVSYLPGHTPSMFDEKPKEPLWLKNQIRKRFQFDRIGYSCRGTEFEAALGLSQLDGLQENALQRWRNAKKLIKALGGFSELVLPALEHNRPNTFMMFPIVIKEDSKIDKYSLCLHLEEHGIETRDMMPITNQPCYQINEAAFPVAGWVNRCGFYISCNPDLTDEDIEQIRKAFESHLTKKH